MDTIGAWCDGERIESWAPGLSKPGKIPLRRRLARVYLLVPISGITAQLACRGGCRGRGYCRRLLARWSSPRTCLQTSSSSTSKCNSQVRGHGGEGWGLGALRYGLPSQVRAVWAVAGDQMESLDLRVSDHINGVMGPWALQSTPRTSLPRSPRWPSI